MEFATNSENRSPTQVQRYYSIHSTTYGLTTQLSLNGQTLYRLVFYLEKYNLISKFQAGFRSNESTIDHVTCLHNTCFQSLNDKGLTRVVFLDFSKAYAMLWRDGLGLLKKLRDPKLHGHIYHAINNLITYRTLQVRIKQHTLRKNTYRKRSATRQRNFPHLIPHLYKRLPTDNAHNLTPSVFAADCAFWKDGRNLNHITKALQIHIDKISQWSRDWGLKLNHTKTVEVLFNHKRLKIIPKLKLLWQRNYHSQLNSTKLLGL